MNLLSITLTPRALLRLSRQELMLLLSEAGMHYDGRCRSFAEPGGALYGWRASLEFGNTTDHCEVEATSRDIDTCCKILEMSRDPLAGRLSWALGQAHGTIGNAYATFKMEDA